MHLLPASLLRLFVLAVVAAPCRGMLVQRLVSLTRHTPPASGYWHMAYVYQQDKFTYISGQWFPTDSGCIANHECPMRDVPFKPHVGPLEVFQQVVGLCCACWDAVDEFIFVAIRYYHIVVLGEWQQCVYAPFDSWGSVARSPP